MIVLDQIGRIYGDKWAVRDLDFSIQHESIHALLGPNGAGKTTTLKMISGLLPPTEGRLSLYGINPQIDFIKAKKMIGLLPETPPLYFEMKVKDYLLWVALLHGYKKNQALPLFDQVVEETGIKSVIHRLIGNLSKGYKQRVGIAQALIHQPKILILDEPTSGLDPHSVVEMREFIKSLKKSRTIIFSSHHLHEVELICDHVSVIHEGKLNAHGTVEEVKQLLSHDEVIEFEWEINSTKNLSELPSFQGIKKIHFNSEGKGRILLEKNFKNNAAIIKWLISEGVELKSFHPLKPELEDVFLVLTQEIHS